MTDTANRQRIATENAVLSDNLALPPELELLPGADVVWLRTSSPSGLRRVV